MKKLFIVMAYVLLLVGNSANAAQSFDVKDGDTINISISVGEVNRLAISGEGRLKKVWSPDGYLDLEPDKTQGEAFFKASKLAPAHFSFFARDDFGNTFTIMASQKAIPSQTIILSPKRVPSTIDDVAQRKVKALPYKQGVNQLFKLMYNNLIGNGYAISTGDTEVPLWEETSISLISRYEGRQFIGEIYKIKNKTSENMTFHESEFFGFGRDVIAVGLEVLIIKPRDESRLFIVRSSHSGGVK